MDGRKLDRTNSQTYVHVTGEFCVWHLARSISFPPPRRRRARCDMPYACCKLEHAAGAAVRTSKPSQVVPILDIFLRSKKGFCKYQVETCHDWTSFMKETPRGVPNMFPNAEPGGRGPPSKNLYQALRGGSSSPGLCSLIKNPEEEDPPRRICTRCFEGAPLPLGSFLGNIVNRETHPGEGVSCDQVPKKRQSEVVRWRSISCVRAL